MAAQLNDLSEIRARRLLAQGIARNLGAPVEAARWMLAVQAQQYNSGVELLALRSDATESDVVADIAAGRIVRTWSQRGTHHFLPAEDAQWMMLLCHPRIERAAEKRRPGLSLTPEQFTTAKQALLEALIDGPVTRPEAYELFKANGVDPDGGRGSHILRSVGSCGGVVQAPRDGNIDRFMLVEQLPESPVQLTEDAALAELAERYFTSRGPATVHDLAWWAGITVTAAKRGVKGALSGKGAKALVEVELAGTTYLMGKYQTEFTQQDLADALASDYALPAFDEYIIGYKDRSAQLPAELVPEVGPTRNGLVRPCTVVDGVITGVRA